MPRHEFTIRGKGWRVQLVVSDLREVAVLGGTEPGPGLFFTVTTLPAGARRSTAFYRGQQRYHGPSAAAAWAFVTQFAGVEHQMPRVFARHLAEERAAQKGTDHARQS